MFVMILSTFFNSLQKLELVNGVLFTGGWAKDGLYFETVRRIFKVSVNITTVVIYMHLSEASVLPPVQRFFLRRGCTDASRIQNMNRGWKSYYR